MSQWMLSLACVLTPAVAWGQTPPAAPPEPVPAPVPPVYSYSGQPIALEATCADAELNDFRLTRSEEEPCPLYLELASIEAAGAKDPPVTRPSAPPAAGCRPC